MDAAAEAAEAAVVSKGALARRLMLPSSSQLPKPKPQRVLAAALVPNVHASCAALVAHGGQAAAQWAPARTGSGAWGIRKVTPSRKLEVAFAHYFYGCSCRHVSCRHTYNLLRSVTMCVSVKDSHWDNPCANKVDYDNHGYLSLGQAVFIEQLL